MDEAVAAGPPQQEPPLKAVSEKEQPNEVVSTLKKIELELKPTISLQEQQIAFEARRLKGNRLVTPTKPEDKKEYAKSPAPGQPEWKEWSDQN